MRSQQPLTVDQVREHAPAVFATVPHHSRSEKFTHISTEKVLLAMMDAGYGVSRAQQKNTRSEDRRDFTRHLLSFRPLECFNDPMVGDGIPEIVLVNGHDGTSAYNLFLGIYRMICANGLISGSTFEGFRVMHRSNAPELVVEGSKKVWELIPKLKDWVKLANVTKLTDHQQRVYADKAMSIRYKEDRPFAAEKLLTMRREDDGGTSMWKVYNRVQENLMGGGIESRSITGRRSLTRGINRVTKDVIYNRRLWDLTEDTMKLAA